MNNAINTNTCENTCVIRTVYFLYLNHIAWQCPLLNTQRIDLIKKLNKRKLDIRLLLSQLNIEACACEYVHMYIYHFFKKYKHT